MSETMCADNFELPHTGVTFECIQPVGHDGDHRWEAPVTQDPHSVSWSADVARDDGYAVVRTAPSDEVTVSVNVGDLRAVLPAQLTRDRTDRMGWDIDTVEAATRLVATLPAALPHDPEVVEAVRASLERACIDFTPDVWTIENPADLLAALADEGHTIKPRSWVHEVQDRIAQLEDTIQAMGEECAEVHGELTAENERLTRRNYDLLSAEAQLNRYHSGGGDADDREASESDEVLSPGTDGGPPTSPPLPNYDPFQADCVTCKASCDFAWSVIDGRYGCVVCTSPPPDNASPGEWPDKAVVERVAEMLWNRFGTDHDPWSAVSDRWIRAPWRAWTQELLVAAGPPPESEGVKFWKDKAVEWTKDCAALRAQLAERDTEIEALRELVRVVALDAGSDD